MDHLQGNGLQNNMKNKRIKVEKTAFEKLLDETAEDGNFASVDYEQTWKRPTVDVFDPAKDNISIIHFY
jgi:hypothetical protein